MHWETRQFKRVAEISYGLTLELDRTESEGTYIISLPNITKEGQLLLDDVPRTPLPSEEKKKLLLRRGDLLFNWRNGSPDHVGKTAYFDGDGEYTHVSFLLRIRLNPTKYDSRYYQMFLNNLRNGEFFSSAKTRVNKTYNQTELGRLEVTVPPFEEQRMIADYLDYETAKIDALISRIRTGVEKLKEYSRGLISAAVTGKIDVREASLS
jgi:type I restriction enzyme S subunit